MKKLKKSSKNRKPTVVFIYGPQAVSKFTVSTLLSKKLGYKLAHNHHLNDFVNEIFPRHSYASDVIKDFLRPYLLENVVKAKLNLVTTHCYSHNFVSKTGLSDPKYVETLEKNLFRLGAKFCPVHLKANNVELLRRVTMASRKKFQKLTEQKRMKYLSKICDWDTSPKLKNNFVINNTNIPPRKTANIIIKHFKLR